MRLPKHIGIIPDGNRRWAENNGLSKEKGYNIGINPGLLLFKICQKLGIEEITYYGFTTDNTKRPAKQKDAFTKACIDAVKLLSHEDAELLVVGNIESPCFPPELMQFTKRKVFGKGGLKVNFLVNYGWEWDLNLSRQTYHKRNNFDLVLHSKDISRIDLIIRWGGRRRLSGFLPIQSVYSDFYVVDDYWPDFKPQHIYDALDWYATQDVTLGG
ncbi:undecaprenyl diphosphate synthase family protein [uncultured Clostridium sp.]|uniref:undecaprenyl diphosphate synthase family protein n=1 Tax=uncultured Clostridium sp. TaxID=59620 RepID=UPI0025E9C6E9|nr:undecaprenyl diphosphate synthase family protein [uncultured Clostridium sp.]